jgi:hypothetical protein
MFDRTWCLSLRPLRGSAHRGSRVVELLRHGGRGNARTVDVGYRACSAFGRCGKNAAVQTVLTAYNSDTSSSASYYATLFAQYAAHDLCPEHDGEIGPI